METLNKLLAIDSNYFIIGLFILVYGLELWLSNPFKFDKRPQHLFQNMLFQAAFLFVNYFFAKFLVLSINWFNNNHVGLFYLVSVPVWAKLLLSVPIFDFTTYWIHRSTHKIPFLWRFHRVHHSDTTMDSSTYFRGHPLESIMVFGVGNIITAAIFGLNLIGLGLYFLVVLPFLIAQHVNLEHSIWIDKTFGKVFATPNLHKIHHEQDQHFTDSNFADIFIFWDKLFGTYSYKPVKKIKYGLKEFDEDRKQTFWYLIKAPFMNVKRISSEELNERNI